MINSTYPIEIKASFNVSVPDSSLSSANTDSPVSSSGPAYAIYGHLANNLTLPTGAKAFFAYTPFQASGIMSKGSKLSAEVDVMLPQFDCEVARITTDPIDQDPSITSFSSRATFETPSCTVEHAVLRAGDPKHFPCPPKQLVGQWSPVNCIERRTGISSWASEAVGELDIRFMVAVTDFRYTQTPAYSVDSFNDSFFNATDSSISIEGIKGVICKPAYSLTKANLTYDVSKKDESDRFSIAVPINTSYKTLKRFSFYNLSVAVDASLSLSDAILGIDSSSAADLESEGFDIVTKLMLLASAGVRDQHGPHGLFRG